MTNSNTDAPQTAVLAIHGGLAWPRENLTVDDEAHVRAALEESLLSGFAELQRNSTGAIDAVIAAVRVLEDSPHFNAGKGSVLTRTGAIQMDAAIMDGRNRQAGAVAAVTRIRNPICAAQAVMLSVGPVFIVGNDADQFAAGHGLEMADPEYFRTERRWNDFQAWQQAQQNGDSQKLAASRMRASMGTVGAVALDQQENLAAATSTGGVSYKVPGRVGDTAVIGAGTFADNRTCAISATGQGELFIRSSAAYSVSARMMYGGQNLAESAQEAVNDIHNLGGEGGIIAIDRYGNLAMPFHAKGMYRGSIGASGDVRIALYDN
jgi:L-asparaginase / beta-aspartyl-peptidase